MQTTNGVCTLVKSHFATLIPSELFFLWIGFGGLYILFSEWSRTVRDVDRVRVDDESDRLGVIHVEFVQFLERVLSAAKLHPIDTRRCNNTGISTASCNFVEGCIASDGI